MKLIGLDLETPQEIKEYGLQPWRAKTGDATIKTCAVWSNDGVFAHMQKMPSVKWFRSVLTLCSENEYTIATWGGIFDISWLLAVGLEKEVRACKWLDGILLLKRIDAWRDKEYGGIGFGLKETVADRWPELGGYGLGDDVTKVPQTVEEWKILLDYNLLDSKYTCLLVREYLLSLTPDERRGALIEAKGLVPVAMSYIQGIAINEDAMDELQGSVKELREENLPIFGAEMSIVSSPKKLGKLLFEEWGFEPIKKTPTGNPATDKESLLKLAIRHPDDPRFGALMALRKCNTRQSKFVDGVRKSMEYNGTNITYPKPTIAGTYTGRMSYSSKQNEPAPKKVKKESI